MARSMASRAMTVASRLPVWPTMSPPAKLARMEAATALGDGAVDGVGGLRRAHPRPLLEGYLVGADLDVLLQGVVELARPVAVPEVGDVAELLGFRAGELGYAGRRQIFAQGGADLGGLHQIVLGYAQVAVVEHHAGERNVRHPAPVEAVEPRPGSEGPGHLHGAVAAEVEEDHPVAVLNGGHRGAVRFPHGERRQHLVADAGLLGAEVLHRGRRAVKSRGRAQDVGTPAPGDDAPVGLVPVHGHHHPAAAGGDTVVAAAFVRGCSPSTASSRSR